MSRPIRILHTSDVHLGAHRPADGEHHARRRDRMHATFARVVDLAVAERVDLMLVAGDFFDHVRVSHDTIRFAVEQLARVPAPVVILPGNHDHVGEGAIYERVDFAAETGNVRVIGTNEGETLTFPSLDLALWGRADHGGRRAYRPLEAPPSRGRERWQLAIAHGHYVPPGESSDRSYLIYAEEIEACGRDYVAMGHWDRFVEVRHGDVTACYSGAPESLGPHSSVVSGVVALVTLDDAAGVIIDARRVAMHGEE